MIKLELPSIDRKKEAIKYIQEFHTYNSAINGTGGLDISNYEAWLDKVLLSHQGIVMRKDRVPASTYFAIVNDQIVGMVNIRHALNDYLITSGSGHIGFSVRPTERRKGYATMILKNALNILKNDYQISQVLVGCYETNTGSQKTILNCGGNLKERINEEGKITLAYNINLK